MNIGAAPLSFNARAAALLPRIEYRRTGDDDEREAIFRLRYDGYLRDGGIAPNTSGRFTDRWDEVDNAELIGVYLDGELAASVRIHVSGEDADIPAIDVFGDVVRPYIGRGLRLIDATRFVIDYRHASTWPQMPFLTLRAVAMAAEHFMTYGMLATVRQEHALVYRRVTGHRALSEPRAYPLLQKPIVCMLAETASLDTVPYAKHPFLRSTEEERVGLFGAVPATPFPFLHKDAVRAAAD